MKTILLIIAAISVVGLAIYTFEIASTHLDTKEFQFAKSAYSRWEDVFDKAPSVKLEIIKTGEINIPLSGVLNMSRPEANGIKDQMKRVPALAILITRGNKHYLIDTGFDSSFYNRGGNMRGLLIKHERYSQKKGEDIVNQLNKRSVTVDTVFFTHLHPDHMSGAPELPASTSFVFDKNATYINYPFIYGGNLLKRKKNLFTIDFEKSDKMPILGKCVDIFGDGSFWAVSTPGHSTGHISYIVKTEKTIYLLTGDASITQWGFEHGVEPGSFSTGKREAAVVSLKKLMKFHTQYASIVTTVFGHEY